MNEQYGVQRHYVNNPETSRTSASHYKLTDREYYYIEWHDTLEEAIEAASGEPIIKSISYEIRELIK